MYSTILLATDGSPCAVAAGQTAAHLGQKLGSAVVALHVTDIRLLEGPLLADLSGAMGAQPYPAWLPQLRAIHAAKAQTILAAAAAQCRAVNVPCETVHETGPLTRTVLHYERRADLVVLGRHGEHAGSHGETLGSNVERFVRRSTQLCWVTPAAYREPRRVLIAHDGSAESTRALEVAVNLAVALGAAVTLLTACAPGHEDDLAPVLQKGRELAEARGLTTRAQLVHEHPETAILRLAVEIGADLIVMGAYGHTRIREMILGSTTSQVLHRTDTAVLLVRGK
jgi:nucleotide-binding universal stress UspA family protein